MLEDGILRRFVVVVAVGVIKTMDAGCNRRRTAGVCALGTSGVTDLAYGAVTRRIFAEQQKCTTFSSKVSFFFFFTYYLAFATLNGCVHMCA
uniref:Putative secreted protein n=1 Tax=Ixodes ricinus TaxID=34613 RepID=A0A6B0U1M4_IXORI